MIIIYRFLINLVFILSPIIIILRLFKKKESLKRFKEKFCIFTKKRVSGKVLWFHGASVGELQSIITLLEKIEKNKNIKQVLVTSNTLSSSKIFEKYKFKKVIHQFFPIDNNFLSIKFLNYWRPSSVFFIDSEIWPNMIFNLKKKNIPIILLNGRITKKTFYRWNNLPFFTKEIFSKFDLCLSSNSESIKFLLRLGAKKVKYIGNLKYSQSENEIVKVDKKLKDFIAKKKYWCASSTHKSEEKFCGLVHNKLKKKYKNLLTIIIPRHIERVNDIMDDLIKLNLKVHLHESKKKIKNDTDIYIVNSYGKTKSFFKICNNVFLGGSIINHGGQNPLEAARYGCNILHGPNVSNFYEIYQFLRQNKISQRVSNENNLLKSLNTLFARKSNSKKIQQKLNMIGNEILKKTYKEIEYLI